MSLFQLTHQNVMAKYAGIPGPEPSLPLGNAGALLTQWPWEACAEWGRTYGGMCLIWLAGTPAIVLNDPDLIGRVLDTEWTNYYKRDPHDAVAPVIRPEDLFIANGEPWREKRSTSPLNRDYTGEWLNSQIPNLRSFAASTVDSWIGQEFSDLVEPLRRLAYDLIALAVWGEPLGDSSFDDFMGMARTGNTRMAEPPFLQQIPPLNPLFYVDRNRWYSGFAERVKKLAAPGSLLDVAKRMNTWEDEKLVQALAPGVFYGGVFSVAAGIAHTLDFLHRDTQCLVDVVNDLPSSADKSEILDHALRESLRLSPPVTLWFRSVNADAPATLGGHTLPADTMIFISNWLLHRDPAHWSEADSWKPSRWAGGGVDRDPPGSGYFFPFGRGPRTCVGQSFAFVLMKVVLAEVLLRSKVQLDLAREQKSDFFFAVQHPKSLKARFEKK